MNDKLISVLKRIGNYSDCIDDEICFTDEELGEVINAVLDKVVAITLVPPEYIKNSQSHQRGYNKALDQMVIEINKLRGI